MRSDQELDELTARADQAINNAQKARETVMRSISRPKCVRCGKWFNQEDEHDPAAVCFHCRTIKP